MGEQTSSARQALLQALLAQRQRGAGVSASPRVEPVSREGDLALSFGQERLWFLDQWRPGSATYHVPIAVRLTGRLDWQALEQSLNALIRRHEILRTRYTTVSNKPVQVVEPEMVLRLDRRDLRARPESERADALRHLLTEEVREPFDLAAGRLIRATLLTLQDEVHVLLLNLHHIAFDGWSLGVLLREIAVGYEAFAAGDEPTLPALSIQYADAAAWQRQWLQGERLEQQLAYWKQKLAGAPPLLELPIDFRRPPIPTSLGRTRHFTLPGPLVLALSDLGRQEGATLFMVLLAAFQVLLMRYSGQEDLVIGTPVANRNRPEFEGLIGYFVNSLALRTDLSGDPTFRELLRRVRAMTLEAYDHQDLPFERLLDELQLGRQLSYAPLFQVMFALNNAPIRSFSFGGLAIETLPVETQTAKFDLTMELYESPDGLQGRLEYNADLFTEGRITRMVGHYLELLQGILANPAEAVGRLPLLTAAEREPVRSKDQAPATAVDRPLHRWFEAQVEQTPDHVALTCGAERITYRELNRRANRLAHYLRRHGVVPDSRVALFQERGPEMVVAILAVLKAGGAYVPMDPTHPRDRLAFVLEDAGATMLLTQRSLQEQVPAYAGGLIWLDETDLSVEPESNPEGGAAPHNLAYVIYTSGSTGKPKGVLIEHRNVTRLFTATDSWFAFGEQDVWTLFHSYAFDFSVWEIWGALLYGGRLVVVPYLVSRSPELFAELLVQEQVTVLNQTPSAFRQLIKVEDDPARRLEGLALRLVIFGGEALDLQSLRPWFERHGDLQPQLVNMYGITETTVHVTYRPLSMADVESGSGSVIGGPIPDLQIYVVDRHLQPVPVGVPGELLVGGAGVAQGYLNRPELTAERFITDRWSGEEGARLYRSGDLARYLENGDLEYLGRIDHQVKLRGFRIELGEIEATLSKHPGVREVTVLLREDQPGQQRLVAYVVSRPGGERPTVIELREFMERSLPVYMVPAVFVWLDALPLTTNGKVNRQALPVPAFERDELGGSYVAPQTPAEAELAQIWATLLELDRVGVDDNFFTVGGDSIRAIQAIGRAKEVGLHFTLQQLFQHQTIRSLAEVVTTVDAATKSPGGTQAFALITAEDRSLLPAGIEDAYPVTALQFGMLYHMLYTPSSRLYHNLASYHMRAPLEPALLQAAVQHVVRQHPVLRTSFDFTTYSEPLQLVHAEADLPVSVVDIRHLSEAEQEAAVDAWLEQEKAGRFDLARPPLLRLHLFRRSDETFEFIITECHAILDGWSLTSIIGELFECYFLLLAGKPAPVSAPTALSYRDFVRLERQIVQSAESKAFWQEQLQGAPSGRLPRWTAERSDQEHSFQRAVQPIGFDVHEGLKRLAREAGVSLKHVLLAAHLRVMSQVTGQADVVTGLVTNGRMEELDGDRVRGLFLNTVPLRVNVSDCNWIELVQQAFAAETALLPHRRYPLATLQKEMGREALFETAFNFVQFHALNDLVGTGQLEILGVKEYADTNFTCMAAFSVLPGENLILMLDSDGAVVSPEHLEAMRDTYVQTLTAMAADPAADHVVLDLRSTLEKEQMATWNQTDRPYDLSRCLHEQIEAQVSRTPDAVAVQFADRRWSYADLNRYANQLANYLRRAGVGPGVLVGVAMERSLELVAALLAVLKAGGAYVPLDPGYPAERLARMVEDAEPPVLLTQQHLAAHLPAAGARLICVDAEWAMIGQEDGGNPASGVTPEDLAYVIFTSGSTGRPKGAMNTHRSICNRLIWMQQEYGLTVEDRVLQKTPFSFDVSVWEFFWPLLTGARLVVAAPGGHQDTAYLVNLIQTEAITTLHFVPSMLQLFLEEPGIQRCQSLRRVICSGEALPYELQERFFKRVGAELHNLYGPTEAAVDVTYWACDRNDRRRIVPIGRPVANTQILIVNERMRPVGIGVPGELLIGGLQVGKGYLKRPELTAERFIPNPFGEGRLYRTGDLARWLPDGSIEYLGRLDHQVKIRGNRIELGEVEAALSAHPAVRESLVVARADQPGVQRLVAYLVPNQADAPPTVADLRGFLKATLPDYMIPSAFVIMTAMPLSPNGKVDRKSLPAPEPERLQTGQAYVEPTTPTEELLASIWAQVLGHDRVGTADNFFELGGDSILAIQVVARANKAGLQLSPRLLFEHQTVAKLAQVAASSRAIVAEQGEVVGSVPLTPVQRWFFAQGRTEPHHFNQALLLDLTQQMDPALVAEALRTLLRHHDALRLRFDTTAEGWQQVNAATADHPDGFQFVDLSGAPPAEQSRLIESTAQALQRSLNLTSGPLLQVVLFRRGAGRPDTLLLIMHHLIVDGVSWRILLEDFQSVYQQLSAGHPVELSAKTTSYRQWAERLVAYAASDALHQELPYWLSLAQPAPELLPLDESGGLNTEESSALLSVELSAPDTTALLHEVPRAYRTQINDILLAALMMAYHRWAGHRRLLVDLEGHGREDLFNDLDLTRTVGWFTAIYPVMLELVGAGDPGEMLKTVKEMLRRIPGRGVGYGLLRYLAPETDAVRQLRAMPQPQVLFNYLGQLDQTAGAGFARAQESVGPTRGAQGMRHHQLGLDAAVTDGRLQITWAYSTNLHRQASVQALADLYLEALRTIIAHCRAPQAGGFTPSDFPKAKVNQGELDKLLAKLGKR